MRVMAAAVVLALVALTGCYDMHLRAGGGATRDRGGPGLDGGTRRDAGAPVGTRDAGRSTLDAGGSAGLDAGAGAPAGEQAYLWCLAANDLFCRGNIRCCPDPRRVPFDDPAECAEVIDVVCDVFRRGAFVDGRIRWDADGARRTLEEMRSGLETCGSSGFGTWPKWLTGTLPEGADCTPPELGGMGETLDGTRWVCSPGLYCQVTGTASDYRGTCRPRGREGAPCYDPLRDCRAEYWCDWTSTPPGSPPSEGSCAPRRPDGAPCRTSFECDSLVCDDGRCAPHLPSRDWCIFIG